MAKDTDVVNSDPQTEVVLPDPQISGPPTGQPLDQAGDSSAAVADFLASPEFDALVDKKVQSKTDRQFGKHGTRLDKLESPDSTIERYEALQAQGLSKDQAISKMQGDQDLADTKARLAVLEGKAPEASPGGGEKGWKERRASILSDAGVEGSDPRFVEFMKQEFTSHDDMNEKLFTATEGWSFTDETKPKPDSSTIAQTITSTPVIGDDYKGLSDDELGARSIALGKEPTKNKVELAKINKALERRDKIK